MRLANSGMELRAFFDAADRMLATLVPSEDACWLSLDPATHLPTGHFTREVAGDHLLELAANEFLEDDVNKFTSLTRAVPPVGTLLAATGGDPTRSPRFTNLLGPLGYESGDEMRAVFLDGDSAWGCVALHRRRGQFTESEVSLLAGMCGDIAKGIRRSILATASRMGGSRDDPGLVLLRDDDTIESLTPAARRWISEVVDPTGGSSGLPMTILSVAHRARAAYRGDEHDVAQARFPRRAGGWLIVDASMLEGDPGGRVALILQPARTPEIAPLIAAAHGLSRRQSEVAGLVLQGLPTREIASRLGVTPYTVQDHLKAIFEKVGVRTRRELVARMFLQHYAPGLQAHAEIDADGWFRDASALPRPRGQAPTQRPWEVAQR